MAKIRSYIQGLSALFFNGHLRGFITGQIYTGPGKRICVPVLNCYSCPGALGACPIGSLQGILAQGGGRLSYYVGGMILAFGMVFGRFICGFLCPFGWFQDLLYRIPIKKRKESSFLRKTGKGFKILLTGVFVFLLPMFWMRTGRGDPTFCKYICPAGILEGALPLMAKNPGLREVAGGLFLWKALLALGILLSCASVYRVFCKYFCPLGLFYGLLNSLAFTGLSCNKEACVHCGRCAEVCKMAVDPSVTPDHGECIRCGDCIRVCPTEALAYRSPFSKKTGHFLPSKEKSSGH